MITRGFNLHFSHDYWCWASFHVPVGLSYVFSGKMSIPKCPLPIFKLHYYLPLSCMSSLCLTPYQMYGLRRLFPIQLVVFSLCWWFLLLCRSFWVWCSPLIYFVASVLGVILKKRHIKSFLTHVKELFSCISFFDGFLFTLLCCSCIVFLILFSCLCFLLIH